MISSLEADLHCHEQSHHTEHCLYGFLLSDRPVEGNNLSCKLPRHLLALAAFAKIEGGPSRAARCCRTLSPDPRSVSST